MDGREPAPYWTDPLGGPILTRIKDILMILLNNTLYYHHASRRDEHGIPRGGQAVPPGCHCVREESEVYPFAAVAAQEEPA